MRVIAFKIWGDYAHFRRQYTTSSPLTYSIMPLSVARGIIGGIMGYSRKEYPDILHPNKTKLGIRLLKPVKKIRIGINLLDTKDGGWVNLDTSTMKPSLKKDGSGNFRLHTQVRVEFLKDPTFEVFFNHIDKDLMDEFSQKLKEHRTVYTPYLGITECIGNFAFLWDMEVEPFEGEANILSAFTKDRVEKLYLKEQVSLLKESIPTFLNADRIREKSSDVIFNPYAEPTSAYVKGAFLYPTGQNDAFVFID